ncbi:MAG: PhaM family polyhydroxyalkanoate granule multifunctional regulatory protein [Burkholderiales bacterium]
MSQPPDPFEFLKSLWGPMGLPMAGMTTPAVNPGEIDKRIADLKLVENWLNINLNVLRMTIQGLEVQKSTLAAMQGAMVQSAQPAGAENQTGSNPATLAEAWWSALQQSAASGRTDPPKK